MIYRETGQFKTSYRLDQAIFPIAQDRWAMYLLIAIAYLLIPWMANEYWLQAILIPFLIFAMAALGLNLLTGYAGQLSLGTGGFMAVGAYAAYKLTTAFPVLPMPLVFLAGGPHHRCRGYYFWPAELAHQRVVSWPWPRWRRSFF